MGIKKKLRIVFSVILADAGEATRALEMAGGISNYCPDGYEVDIIFLSNGSRFEERVISNGFGIYKCNPTLSGIGVLHDFETTNTNIFGNVKLATEMLEGEIQALAELKPDLIIYGFNPIAGLARRMMDKPIPGICYLPIPLQEDLYVTTLMKDIPDMFKPITYLPLGFRRIILKSIPKVLKLRVPTFKQYNILEALKGFEWNGKEVRNIFDMLEAELTIVNDFEDFYKDDLLADNFKIAGPLYAPASNNDEIDENILKLFNSDNKRLKIFCTLGSSGRKQYLFEAIKALTQGIGKEWDAVILAPKAVCPIDEAIACAGNSTNVYITDSFVPAPLVNELADIVISHGGQGTIQTAIASGTPIVGFAMQPEQQINLDNLVMRGAGIRIPIHKWNASNIQYAIKNIVKETSYKENIKVLKKLLEATDGKKDASLSIWEFIVNKIDLDEEYK